MRALLSLLVLMFSSLLLVGETVNFTTIADGSAAMYTLGGTTVTGSSNVTSGIITTFRGLGIQGGGSSLSLDYTETLTINYNRLVNNVFLTVIDVEPVGNGTLNFTAFNGATNLGLFYFPTATTAPQTFSVSTLINGQSLTSLTLGVPVSAPPIGFQIQATSFDAANVSAVPEPATLLLCVPLLSCLLLLRRHKAAVGGSSAPAGLPENQRT